MTLRISSWVKIWFNILILSYGENLLFSIAYSSSSTTIYDLVGRFAFVIDAMKMFMNQVKLYLYIGLTLRKFFKAKNRLAALRATPAYRLRDFCKNWFVYWIFLRFWATISAEALLFFRQSMRVFEDRILSSSTPKFYRIFSSVSFRILMLSNVSLVFSLKLCSRSGLSFATTIERMFWVRPSTLTKKLIC